MRLLKRRPWSVLPWLLVCAPAVGAQVPRPHPPAHVPTAADLYGRSLSADDNFTYEGHQITTYWRSGHAAAVVVRHMVPGLRRLDYQAPERLEGQIFLSDGRQQWRYYPRAHIVRHQFLAPDADAVADAAAAYSLLKSNYLVSVAPQKQFYDNRKVFLLTIAHRRPHVVSRRLWIDAATGLVLKREIYREDGRLAVTVAFSDITFHPKLTRAAFSPARLFHGIRVVQEKSGAEHPIPVASVPRLAGRWLTPAALAGYRLVGAALTQGRKPLLHLRYSDGLNLVSLFEQRRTQTRQPTRVPGSMRPLRIGGVWGHVVSHASLTAINWDTAVFNLTLIGETAPQQLQQLAQALDDRRP